MKKLLALCIVGSYMLWIFHGMSCAKPVVPAGTVSVSDIRSCQGVVRIIQTSFVESMAGIVTFACRAATDNASTAQSDKNPQPAADDDCPVSVGTCSNPSNLTSSLNHVYSIVPLSGTSSVHTAVFTLLVLWTTMCITPPGRRFTQYRARGETEAFFSAGVTVYSKPLMSW